MNSQGADNPAEYVAARRTLLDALDALATHRSSLILIGAQAVYIHAPSMGSNVAPMTTDADLAVDADLLADNPEIASTLRKAGFGVGQPGHWQNPQGIAIDLMVAPHQAKRPPGSRAADLRPHAKEVARITAGLAATLTDNAARRIASLDPGDTRTHQIRVAGPAALLVAKAIKIDDRLSDARMGNLQRVIDKDALDILRLIQAVEITVLIRGLRAHPSESPAGVEVERAISILETLAAKATDPIPQLAARAAGDDPTASASLAALVSELLTAWNT